MEDTFFAYLQRLEMIAFFSAYPLMYTIILFITGNQKVKSNFKSRLASLLPFAYALVGTLYIGLQLKNLYPDYSIENIKLSVEQPYMKIWALLTVLFWIPVISKKTVLSLLHSLVFFFLLIKDLFVQSSLSNGGNHIIKNVMKVYTDSLLINVFSLIVVAVVYFLFLRIRQNNKPDPAQ